MVSSSWRGQNPIYEQSFHHRSSGMIKNSDHSTSVVKRTLSLLLLLRLARVRLRALAERLGRWKELRRFESLCESRLEGLATRVGARRGVSVAVSGTRSVTSSVLTEGVPSCGRGGWIADVSLVIYIHHLKKAWIWITKWKINYYWAEIILFLKSQLSSVFCWWFVANLPYKTNENTLWRWINLQRQLKGPFK